jgi:hypothetical protein
MAKVKYTPNPSGLREIGQSSGAGRAAMEGARAVQRFAQADNPSGAYETSPATVTAGWENEPRSGARVTETRMKAGARKRTLARAAEQAR